MNALILVLTFITMEAVAWLTHKYVMHGFLWTLHEDHHTGKSGRFEKNDLFFLIFAIPGFLCTYNGALQGFNFLFWIGIGICLYGFAYFVVHEVFIHQRFSWLKKTNNFYFLTIRRVHKLHHKNNQKHNGAFFGMLWVPLNFLRNK
jgi:beta-carotene 3-hydroxylase